LPSDGTGLDPKVLLVENDCIRKVIELNQANESIVNEIEQLLPEDISPSEDKEMKTVVSDNKISFNHISKIDLNEEFCSMVDNDINKIISYKVGDQEMKEIVINLESYTKIEKDLFSKVNVSVYSDYKNELLKNNINLINYHSSRIEGKTHFIASEFSYVYERSAELFIGKIPFIFQYSEEMGVEMATPIITNNDSIVVDFSSDFCIAKDLVAFKLNKLFDERIYIGIFRLRNGVYQMESLFEPFTPDEYKIGLALSNVSMELQGNKLLVGYSYYAVIVEFDILTNKQVNYIMDTKFYSQSDFKTTFTYTLLDLNFTEYGEFRGVFWDKGEYYMFILNGEGQKTFPLELGSGISNNRFAFKVFDRSVYFIDNENDNLQLSRKLF